jgi:hypothetical protein
MAPTPRAVALVLVPALVLAFAFSYVGATIPQVSRLAIGPGEGAQLRQ